MRKALIKSKINRTVLLPVATYFLLTSVTVDAETDDILGKSAYESNCAACHQSTGEGLPPVFPALKDNKLVNSDDLEEQINIVLRGKPGTSMLSFANISDSDLAAIISYTRTAWGNKGGAVTATDVNRVREQIK